jgi:hypothetical protein
MISITFLKAMEEKLRINFLFGVHHNMEDIVNQMILIRVKNGKRIKKWKMIMMMKWKMK